MTSGKLLEDHTVVIEDGVIRIVAPSAEVNVTGLQSVDGSGRYLMPALAEMHAHVTDPAVCNLYLANGIACIRNMDGKPWHIAYSRSIESGHVFGPRVLTVSPLVDGLGEEGLTGYPGSQVLTDPSLADALVRRLVDRGYREVKAYQWLSLEVLAALGAAAARAGVRMAGHCPDGLTFEQSIDAGMGCFEHLTGIATGHLRGGLSAPSLRSTLTRRGTPRLLELLGRHLDFGSLRRLAHTMAVKDIWNCPTLVVWQQQIQRPLEILANPELQYEHPVAVKAWTRGLSDRVASLECSPEEWIALGRARDEALSRVVSILHEEGAPILLGTDAPNPFVVHGVSLHRELANLTRAGLSPFQALCCGTIEAARYLGESSTRGSVSVGKAADLLLLGSNPFEDVQALQKDLQLVVVNGHLLERKDLDRLLADHAASLREVPESLSAPSARRGGIVHGGAFEERCDGILVGRGSFRHNLLPGGRRRVDELVARTGPRGRQRRTARLWVEPDWTLIRARIATETDAGTECWDIRKSKGAYVTRVEQPDGHVCESRTGNEGLVPGERLAFSVLPAWCASNQRSARLSTLSIDHEVASVRTLVAEPLSAPAHSPTASVNWKVTVERPGEVSSQAMEISADGTLLVLRDLLFGAPRELKLEQPAEIDRPLETPRKQGRKGKA